jgi:anti-sigma factor RsiW
MNGPLSQRLRESGWRRRRSPSEEAELRAWLAAHPEREAEWEAEAALTEAMARLPDCPVPSNFTARVIQAATQEASAKPAPRAARWSWIWRTLVPNAAAAALILGLVLVSRERRVLRERTELARNVAALSDVAAIPDPQMLRDFDAIRSLDQAPPADDELIALLK